MKRKMNNKGFTLVELIIVMVIMAILVGVVAPNVIKYVEKARESSDLQVESSLFSAVQTAITTSDSTVPAISDSTLDGISSESAVAAEVTILTSIEAEIIELSNLASDTEVADKCKSKKDGTIKINYTPSTGEISVQIGTLEKMTN